MDATAVNVNVTVDDFDSILSYADQSVWETPDPSSATFNASNSPWLMGTFHETDTVGAFLSINFTGPAIYVYGHAGPSYGSYEIQIDSWNSTFSAYAPTNASTPYLLYGANNLTYGTHNLVLRNAGKLAGDAGGDTLLFDYMQTTMQVAPAGATVTNTTFQEDNSVMTYTGTWANNTSPAFSGGGTAFTHEDNASVSMSFHGSAIYMFGDKKNDHGLYSVELDNRPLEVYSGISGCGGAYGMTCEQQQPTLQYLTHNLDGSLHTITIVNIAGVNNSFFDFDSIVVTVPSVYAVRQLLNASSPFVIAGTSGTTATSPPGASGTLGVAKNTNGSLGMTHSLFMTNHLYLLAIGLLWFLRRGMASL